MKKTLLILFVNFLLISLSTAVKSQSRCDCTSKGWVGDCQAKVELKGKWFKIISSTQQCSRVDWYIDAEPKVTIVTDGAEIEEWLGPSQPKNYFVDSCKVCTDNQLGKNSATEKSNYIQNNSLPNLLNGYWCSGGSWKVRWEVSGNRLVSYGWSGMEQQRNWELIITGDNSFKLVGHGTTNEYDIVNRDLIERSGLFFNVDIERCKQ